LPVVLSDTFTNFAKASITDERFIYGTFRATLMALIFLLIYMAFRFTFTMGLAAIVCLLHDLCILHGFFAWTGKEFNLTILAAMLTVIGYDVNDTIVVCDRTERI
jgi:preprotein translocase subunit SecF